jgi:purine-binding chemotaxis protein CheW
MSDEAGPVEVLVFEAAGQRYGLEASAVREVVRAVAVTPLPGAPPAVEGVINVRGRVVPVLGARARFGLPAREPGPDDHLIVTDLGGRVVALRVDRALGLARVSPAAVEGGEGGGPVRVAKGDDGLVLLAGAAALLG